MPRAILCWTVLLFVGCEAEPGERCNTARDCGPGRLCVDERCIAPPDASADAGSTDPRDAGPRDATPARPDAVPVDAVCASVESEAVEIRRPIDAIVLPDESASMGPARASVANAMETTFRLAMEAAGVDYRVIWHGETELPMLEAAGRLTRNPVDLGSGPSFMFKPVLDTYDAWRPALRDDALKVFVHFTDATSGTGASITGYVGTLDEVLVAREPSVWGSSSELRFVYHAFVGLTPNTPVEEPYTPDAPVVPGTCSGAFVSPEPLQQLARRTGGFRYPLCFPERFEGVFRRIAEAAITRVTAACELEVPEPPDGMTLDFSTLAVRYRDGAGGTSVLLRAESAGGCDDRSFLLEADRVVLCPEACRRVEADPGAALTVLTGCDPTLY